MAKAHLGPALVADPPSVVRIAHSHKSHALCTDEVEIRGIFSGYARRICFLS